MSVVATREWFSRAGVRAVERWPRPATFVEVTVWREFGEWYVHYCFDFDEEGVPFRHHITDHYEGGRAARDAARAILGALLRELEE